MDKTSSESSHVRVLPLIEASGLLLKINVTILSEIEGSIYVAMTRETVTPKAHNQTVSRIILMNNANVGGL